MKFLKTKLDYQIEEYLEWKESHGALLYELKRTLAIFSTSTKAKKIQDVMYAEIRAFYEKLYTINTSDLQIERGMKDVRSMFRYFNARKYPVLKPDFITSAIVYDEKIRDNLVSTKKTGRPRNMAMVREVKRLRAQHYTFKQIQKILGLSSTKSVWNWYVFGKTLENEG